MADLDIVRTEEGFSIMIEGELIPVPIKFMRVSEREKLTDLIKYIILRVQAQAVAEIEMSSKEKILSVMAVNQKCAEIDLQHIRSKTVPENLHLADDDGEFPLQD